jgi:hypothetical protein
MRNLKNQCNIFRSHFRKPNQASQLPKKSKSSFKYLSLLTRARREAKTLSKFRELETSLSRERKKIVCKKSEIKLFNRLRILWTTWSDRSAGEIFSGTFFSCPKTKVRRRERRNRTRSLRRKTRIWGTRFSRREKKFSIKNPIESSLFRRPRPRRPRRPRHRHRRQARKRRIIYRRFEN